MASYRLKTVMLVALMAVLAGSAGFTMAGEGISQQEFARLHALVKPQAGESRWMEIDWYPSVWEARRQAAAQGKPLLLMAGSGGAPAAGC